MSGVIRGCQGMPWDVRGCQVKLGDLRDVRESQGMPGDVRGSQET